MLYRLFSYIVHYVSCYIFNFIYEYLFSECNDRSNIITTTKLYWSWLAQWFRGSGAIWAGNATLGEYWIATGLGHFLHNELGLHLLQRPKINKLNSFKFNHPRQYHTYVESGKHTFFFVCSGHCKIHCKIALCNMQEMSQNGDDSIFAYDSGSSKFRLRFLRLAVKTESIAFQIFFPDSLGKKIGHPSLFFYIVASFLR